MEFGITAKPITSGNPMSNAVLESINQVLGSIIWTFKISTQTYIEENDLWAGILAAEEFSVYSTTNRQKVNSLGQLIFGPDMILPIKHRVYWELICQQKQKQIERYNT